MQGDKSYIKILSLIIIIIIVIFRAPSLLIEPRFWAEEGLTYFSYAYSHSWYETLLFVPTFGYYALFVNLSVLLATSVPLKYAPFVTTYLSLLAQVIPFIIIFWYDSRFFDTFSKKVLISLIILFSTSTGELWLNTIHAHFHFALTTFLILMIDVGNSDAWKKWFIRITLVFAGLTGVLSCFFTPLFIWKAYQVRDKEYTIQAMILVLCSLLQFNVFLMLLMKGNMAGRLKPTTDFQWYSFIKKYLIDNILRPIFGIYLVPRYILLHLIIPMIICLGWIFAYSWRDQGKLRILVAFLLTSCLFMIFSMGMAGGQRYAFLPGIILLILIASYIHLNNILVTFKSLVAFILVSLSIIVGIMEYRVRMADFINDDWPKWTHEVSIWQENHDYHLKIWPQWESAKWSMTLEKRE